MKLQFFLPKCSFSGFCNNSASITIDTVLSGGIYFYENYPKETDFLTWSLKADAA